MKLLKKLLPSLAMVLFMASLVACAGSSDRSSTGEYIDDTVVTTRVKAAILKHPDLRSSEINVETFKSVVQLSGFVSSQAEINTVMELVRGIDGVDSVRNDMRLR